MSTPTTTGSQLPWWLIGATGGLAIGTVAFAAGAVWSSRRTKSQLVPASTGLADEVNEYRNGKSSSRSTYPASEPGESGESVFGDESNSMNDNHHLRSQQSEIGDWK